MSDNTKKNSKNSSILGYIIASIALVAIFLFVFITNRKIVFMMDDIWYWHNLVTDEPISSISDIIESQIWHYFNWGGRAVAHSLLQLLLWSGFLCCDILNTLGLALLTLLLGKYGKRKNYLWNILLAISLIIGCNPALRDTLFWQSGCANYLYMSLIYLSFAWMYLNTLSDIKACSNDSCFNSEVLKKNLLMSPSNPILSVLLALLFLVWGILAGWTNENIGPTISMLTIVVECLLIKNKKKLQIWMVTGTFGCIIGSALMILAPGNKIRELEVHNYGNWKLNLCHRVIDYFKPAYEWLSLIILITLFSFILYVLVLKHMPDIITILILSSGILSYGALILSPHIPERAMFGILCFLAWGSIRMLEKVFEESKTHIFRILVTLLCAFIAFMKLFYLFSITAGWYL